MRLPLFELLPLDVEFGPALDGVAGRPDGRVMRGPSKHLLQGDPTQALWRALGERTVSFSKGSWSFFPGYSSPAGPLKVPGLERLALPDEGSFPWRTDLGYFTYPVDHFPSVGADEIWQGCQVLAIKQPRGVGVPVLLALNTELELGGAHEIIFYDGETERYPTLAHAVGDLVRAEGHLPARCVPFYRGGLPSEFRGETVSLQEAIEWVCSWEVELTDRRRAYATLTMTRAGRAMRGALLEQMQGRGFGVDDGAVLAWFMMAPTVEQALGDALAEVPEPRLGQLVSEILHMVGPLLADDPRLQRRHNGAWHWVASE